MSAIADHLHQVRKKIAQAEAQYSRQPGAVQLLAVSKQQSIDSIKDAYFEGQRHFGENYLQEAMEKMAKLANAKTQGEAIQWHFIGVVQSNKTRKIAEHFDWVHSVSNYKIAQRLSEQRPSSRPNLNIFLEVNMDNECSKSGVMPNALNSLAKKIVQLPKLHLRGLMIIPQPRKDFEAQQQIFKKVAEKQQQLIHMELLHQQSD